MYHTKPGHTKSGEKKEREKRRRERGGGEGASKEEGTGDRDMIYRIGQCWLVLKTGERVHVRERRESKVGHTNIRPVPVISRIVHPRVMLF